MKDFNSKEMQMFDDKIDIFSSWNNEELNKLIPDWVDLIQAQENHQMLCSRAGLFNRIDEMMKHVLKSFILAHDARLIDMVIGIIKGRQILPAYINMLTDEYMRKNTIKTPEQAIDFLAKDFNENLSSLITELEGWKNTKI